MQLNQHHHLEKKSPSQAKVNDFDAMMSSFLKDSEDRLTSLKRNTEGKRGGRGGTSFIINYYNEAGNIQSPFLSL